MKRVFHIISKFDLGGAERVAANIAKSRDAGFEYHIVEVLRGSSAFTREFLDELRGAGIVCHRSLMPAFRFHFIAERMAAILFPLRFLWLWLRYRPDVVHAHTEVPDMCVWASWRVFPGIFRRLRLVRTIHNTCLWTGLKRFGRKVERFYQQHGVNVAISKSVLECYTREYGSVPPIIYNGVPEEADGKLPFGGLDPSKTHVLFAGRFDEQKGIRHLIAIVKALQDMPEYQFIICGKGKLEKLVFSELGSLPNVSLRQPVFGLSRFLPSFDYMIMPSEFEGLPLMSVEASFAGLPVICSDCKGLNETVPEDWPLVARGNSMEQYLDIFRRVIPNADRNALARKAKKFVEVRFGVERMRIEYEKLYSVQPGK